MNPDRTDAYLAAVLDPRSGLHVRAYFLESLHREFAYATRHGTLVSVVIARVDGMDALRAEWGSNLLDQALAAVATCLHHAVRAEDLLADWQVGTFALLLRDVDAGTASLVSERLRRTVGRLHEREGDLQFPVTISAGTATTRPDGKENPADLFRQAEANLRMAAEQGGDRVVPGL